MTLPYQKMTNDVFEPEFIDKLSSVIELQESMMSITLENIDQIHQTILSIYEKNSNDQSNFKIHKNKQEFIKFLSSTLLTAAHYRPNQLSPLSQLAGKLFESFDGLKAILIHLPLTVESSQWHIAFLFECYMNKIINEDEAYEILHSYKYYHSSMYGSIYLIFQYFHEVIRRKDPQLYEESFNYLVKNQRRYDINASPEFLKIRKNKISDLNNINENEYYYDQKEEENFTDTVRYWFPKGSILRMVRDDDLESFKEIVSYNVEFNVNDIFEIKSIFCYPEILKRNINYISLAAFFGSAKIFSYLQELGATQNFLFQTNQKPLIRYAISGGNFEIIKKCEIDQDSEVEVDNSIDASVEYFRFSLFKWIYDNKIENFAKYTQIDENPLPHFMMFNQKISFLITAAKVNNMKMLLFLLDNVDGSCDINQSDSYGWKPLHFAAKHRNIEAIKVILNCKLLKLVPKSPNFFLFIF